MPFHQNCQTVQSKRTIISDIFPEEMYFSRMTVGGR
uniref:Uncharacterized protein n=1 Tax=Rhizophora mucronata TaxID=61149 RepID=A0A2P2PED3_RHIMU